MVDFLKPKQKIRVGSWNVRTMYQTGKLAQVVKEMDNYNLDILAVSESRWTGQGKKTLNTGHTIIYSGRNDNQHTEGVAIIMKKGLDNTLLEWKPVGERLMKVRFNSKYTELTIVACYAPTEQADDEEKDIFYDQLQKLIQEVPAHDMLIVIGDMNARVGNNNTGRERYIGPHGCGSINNNGERLCHLCEENLLVVGGTLFQHKTIHKLTWTSPDGRTSSQIDHIIINKKWRTSLQDVKARRGADIGSDHTLLVGVITLKLRKTRGRQERGQKLDSRKLQDTRICKTFQLELKNRFKALEDQEELDLTTFNKAMKEAGEKVLGYSKRKKEEWIRQDTWGRIAERKEVKNQMNTAKSLRIKDQLKNKYRTLDKEVKRMARADKTKYIENLAEEAEVAAKKQDLRTLYNITKTLNGNYSNKDLPVKDANGDTITKEEDKLNRWKQHFETILNRPAPSQSAVILEAEHDLQIDTNPPTLQEVRKAIKSLKNGKAPGIDMVTAEMLKAEDKETPRILTQLFGKIWEDENIPEEWKTGLIVKLPKKGVLSDCNNWRGITLLSLTSKIFSKIILGRMSTVIEPTLRQEQAGFRGGRSCSNHIFTLRQIMEQSAEWNATMYATFIDFEKAFDSLHRETLWKILRNYGIPEKVVSIIRLLYMNFSSQVICGSQLTDSFKISTGVKQGCILSPFLFLLAVDFIMKKVEKQGRRGIRWTLQDVLEDLDFADDIILLSQRHVDSQGKTEDLTIQAAQIGLKVSCKKTKQLRMNAKSHQPVKINGVDIEEASEFTYLGSKVTTDGSADEEIKARISKASQSFACLRNTWKSKKISQKTKLRIYKSNVLTTLLYGAESWKMTKTISHKLEVFQNRCIRRILGIFWPNTISNEELHKRTAVEPITTAIRRRRWKWIGHVLRMSAGAIPKVALTWTPEGKRKRGRPKETWRRSIEKEIKNNGYTWGSLQKIAKDRQQWKSLVAALCASMHEEDK